MNPGETAQLDQELAFLRHYLPAMARMTEVIASWVRWLEAKDGRPMSPAEAASHPTTVHMTRWLKRTRGELRQLGGDPALLHAVEAMIGGIEHLDRALAARAREGGYS